MSAFRQVLIEKVPYGTETISAPWLHPGRWPAKWIQCSSRRTIPAVYAFRLRFTLDESRTIRLHVTADERYILYLDGKLVARGSERGDAANWFFETYDFEAEVGEHVLVAQIWTMGAAAPYAQHSVHPGLFVCPDTPGDLQQFATGLANWEAKDLVGFEFIDLGFAPEVGHRFRLCPHPHDDGFERGTGFGWEPVIPLSFGVSASEAPEYFGEHLLRPATLPAQINRRWEFGRIRHASPRTTGPYRGTDNDVEHAAFWEALIRQDHAIRIQPNCKIRVLLDLQNYLCAYPELVTWGGKDAKITLRWMESLVDDDVRSAKGDRNQIEGKVCPSRAMADVFHPDGAERRVMRPLWWACGRYVEINIETDAEPLTIERLMFIESRYSLERESVFETNDERFFRLQPLMDRALQMCAHETYVDCPYYEQLMYIGDTRLEVLATYVSTSDDRLPRKALKMFDASRNVSGITQSRYPSRFRQTIAPFSLWHIAMVHDFMMWRGDIEFVRQLMPGVRTILDWYSRHAGDDGLVERVTGWNFIDWVPGWNGGVPPGGDDRSGILNLKLAWVLQQAAELEDWVGEPDMSARWRGWASRVATGCFAQFWDDNRGMFADNVERTSYSEHAQALAILGGCFENTDLIEAAGIGLCEAPDLHRATIYFSYYIFEAYGKLNRIDKFFDRLSLWFGLIDRGLMTTIESPEPTRSDCHAWGAHPLVHFYTTILGIRPTRPGFSEYDVNPKLGPLEWASGQIRTPSGTINVYAKDDDVTVRLSASSSEKSPEGGVK